MPLVTVQLKPGNTGANVRELHKQLLAIGAVIAPGEQDAANYGPSTVAAVRAFQHQKGMLNGDAFTVSTGRLLHVASAFDLGGREALRTALREVASAADSGQPQELYQLARYAILAGDYQMAQSIAQRIPNHADVVGVIDPILQLPGQRPRPPEVPYPENFYSYRRPWVDPSAVDHVASDWANLQPTQFSPPQGVGGPPAIAALHSWNEGNDQFNRRHYAAAIAAYDACQDAVLEYFDKFYLDKIELPAGDRPARLVALIRRLHALRDRRMAFWGFFQRRRELLALAELEELDRIVPGDAYASAENFAQRQLGDPTRPPDPDPNPNSPESSIHRVRKDFRERNLDAPLVTLAFVLVPLARAEANRARRQYDAAIGDLRWVLNSIVVERIPLSPSHPLPVRSVFARLACEFIERPFAKLLLAETMLDKADAEYKARTPASAPPAADVEQFQSLKAAQTYLAIKDVFKDEGAYVSRVETAATDLTDAIRQRLADKDTSSQQFQMLGKGILIETITSISTTLPGLDRTRKAHERLLMFTPPAGQTVMRETNPRVYAALLTATARLEQLKAGFNYLGYLDTYVPPWRFQFLLERARYFAEHAKNAQREYMNFLSNAEREEFQELSTSQSVEMEKSNVHIETARVDQVILEVKAARESADLASLHAANARESFETYQQFDEYADRILNTEGASALVSVSIAAEGIHPVAGAIIEGVGDFITGGFFSSSKRKLVEAAQREVEKNNLQLAIDEANKAATVARTQLAAAQAGLVVVGLQRQAALLRHEFAVQNLEFLRNRVLSTEQWYRLVAAIRSVSETYLRYSVELAFLAEQAYEFEADKPINVIRFDYDLSEVGDFLAADFLLRDLDTLEQDLIVTQRQRQQEVRYVLSMAREFPEALQEIRDNGKTTFSLRLEQIEKRFPGLYNLRIGAVDVLPVALMDSTRFSMEVTHLGTSQVRLKAQPDTPPGTPSPSPLNTNDLPVPVGGWLAELQEMWPIKLRVTGPETVVFSGLTRQDANTVFAFATTSQRHAFEALGAAAAWQVDFTARDNQVVPGTLADLLITLTLSGYHDPELRRAVDLAPRTATAATSWLSGRTTFPDALYEFNRSGRMAWNVTRDLLTLTDTLGAVRNVAMLLLPTPGRANYYGSVMSHCEVKVRITSTGNLEILSEIPQVTFTLGGAATPLLITVQATLLPTLPPGAEVSWEFGDGSARQSGASQQHSYAKPGRYTVSLRVVRNGRLSEFQADVVVSRSHADGVKPPVTAFPTLERNVTSTDIPSGHTRVVGTVNAPTADPVIANWRVGEQGGKKGNSANFDLKPGDYTLFFTAVRPLKARVYCTQRHLSGPVFDFNGLSLATNRRFDLNGTEATGVGDNPPANLVAMHLFAEGAQSPVDEWTIELPLVDNAFLRSVGATDVEQYGLAEIQDVVLALEYETTPRSS